MKHLESSPEPSIGPPATATPESSVPTSLAELAQLRAALAALADPVSEAAAIDWLHELEGIKSVAAAAQAKITAVLAQLRDDHERAHGVVKSRRGKGLAVEVALARGDAPPKGTKHLKRPGFCSACYTGLRA